MPSKPQQARAESPPRLIVIATRQTMHAAVQAVGSSPAPITPMGVILMDEADFGGSGPEGAPLLGGEAELRAIHARRHFDSALISLPASMAAAIGRVQGVLRELGVAARFLPTITDVLTGATPTFFSLAAGAPASIDLPSLLGRTIRPTATAATRRLIEGKRVLITGAGGSIGSELARLVAGCEPELIVLMERSDNALFEIDRELGERYGDVERRALLHDVVDREATLAQTREAAPHIVVHAAAHKHVPMMEDHPAHAITNNVFGTVSIADAAREANAERFVMISTDKAVNPTSVMGATKRVAELYIRSMNAHKKESTRFALVRFGNVLGSACSVLPIWQRQLGQGAPITVTDARMTRYFMTIPEAASLVLQAAAIDPREVSEADVFVLDMGQPVNILDLAKRFVRAHGLTPAVVETSDSERSDDFDARAAGRGAILMTGARPGEKLHEELVHAREELLPTAAAGVLAWAGAAPDGGEVVKMLADLEGAKNSGDPRTAVEALQRWISGYSAGGFQPISPEPTVSVA